MMADLENRDVNSHVTEHVHASDFPKCYIPCYTTILHAYYFNLLRYRDIY